GGGLPAEIWRETMERIHTGMPLRPLPMIEPQRPALEPPSSQPAPGQPGNFGDAIRDILGGILGN
ncbi:MAG TPA: hypothetical protein GX700_02985, partial [Paracoccus sp.]|nr:hypothetical protein [Paracoccus sp. (in: a-proteobacteria)]